MHHFQITRDITFVALLTACFAFCQTAKAQLSPPPDGGYPNFNTAEGTNALRNVDLSQAGSNTAIGASALTSHITGDSNTAVGTSALLNDTHGTDNTAVGAFALEGNQASGNTAVGKDALFDNTSGI